MRGASFSAEFICFDAFHVNLGLFTAFLLMYVETFYQGPSAIKSL
jgi:hypothetical protein